MRRTRIYFNWIERLYGYLEAEKFSHKHALCAGVILGYIEPVINLLRECCIEVHRRFNIIGLRSGYDQGIFNYVCLREQDPVQLYPLTCDSTILIKLNKQMRKSITVTDGQIICKANRKAPVIVHQYDRLKLSYSFVQGRYL